MTRRSPLLLLLYFDWENVALMGSGECQQRVSNVESLLRDKTEFAVWCDGPLPGISAVQE